MAENVIEVQMLGALSVSCRGIPAGGQGSRSRKGKNLLAYLLFHHGRMIPVEELVGILGGEQKNAAPVAAFRTMLYRVRRVLEPIQDMTDKPLIVTRGGMCAWNPAVAVELDTERFEAMCRSEVPEGPEGVEHHCRTLEMYRGGFLRELAGEPWVEPLAEYYHALYLSEAETAAAALIEGGRAAEAESLCREALRQAPYNEALYRAVMRARAAQQDRKGAAEAFETLRARLYEDLGVVPEEETRQVYWSILRDGENLLTPESVRAQLRESSPAAGVFICEYSLFKLFYQAEARAAARRGDAIHIGMLTVLANEGSVLSVRELERAMDHLCIQLRKNLRSGDIASRCGPSQYIVMLVQANYENSKRVCDRVVRAFFHAHPRTPVKLKAVVFPLETTFGERGRSENGT